MATKRPTTAGSTPALLSCRTVVGLESMSSATPALASMAAITPPSMTQDLPLPVMIRTDASPATGDRAAPTKSTKVNGMQS
uniref:Uncharacterized protein n=1 Tax=Arundo donax TaxID=35708 RepID=A0A0A9DYL4_ARUDO